MKNKICASFMTLGIIFLAPPTTATPVSGSLGISTTNDTEIATIKFPEDMIAGTNRGDFRDINELSASFTTPTAPQDFDDPSTELKNMTESDLIVDAEALSQDANLVKSIKMNIVDTLYSWTYPTDITTNSTEFEQRFFASEVPTPAGIALLSFALLGFGAIRRNKKQDR